MKFMAMNIIQGSLYVAFDDCAAQAVESVRQRVAIHREREHIVFTKIDETSGAAIDISSFGLPAPAPECYVNSKGDKFYRNKDGKLHREDGPAVELANGTKEWWIDGICSLKSRHPSGPSRGRLTCS